MFLSLFIYLLIIFPVIAANCYPPNQLQPTQRGICIKDYYWNSSDLNYSTCFKESADHTVQGLAFLYFQEVKLSPLPLTALTNTKENNLLIPMTNDQSSLWVI